MQRPAVFILTAGLVAASGCAAQRQAQELNQLKADLGMLDQRVSQLERSSLKQATSWPSDPSVQQPAGQPTPAATSAPASPAPSVKPSKTEIQRALKHAGFYQGPIDGKIGPVTREAIRQFQQVNGLKVDGVVGRQTWEKLSAYLEQTTPTGEELSAAEPLK